MEKGEWHKTSDLYFLRNQYFPTVIRMEGNKKMDADDIDGLLKLLISMKKISLYLFLSSQILSIYIIFFCHFNTTAFLQLYYKFSRVTSPILHRYNPSDNFQTCIPSPDVWKPELHFLPFIRHVHLCNALHPKLKTRPRPHKSGIS